MTFRMRLQDLEVDPATSEKGSILNESLGEDDEEKDNGSKHSQYGTDPSHSHVYTVSYNDVIEMLGFGRYQFLLAIFHAIGWSVEGIQYSLLIVIPAALKCEWNLSEFSVSMIASSNRIGIWCGAFFTGAASDMLGKMCTLRWSSFLLSIFYFISTYSPNVLIMCLMMFVIGFFGSTFASIDSYYNDFLPSKIRATALIFGHFQWSVGLLAAQGFSYIIIQNLSWSVLMYTMAVPSIITFIFSIFLHESPRYKLIHQDLDGAYDILSKVARYNKTDIPDKEFIIKEQRERENVMDLLKSFRVLKLIPTIAYFCISFFIGVIYTSSIMYAPVKPENIIHHTEIQDEITNSTTQSECIYMSKEVNNYYVITSASELFSYPVGALIVYIFGRKIHFISLFLITAMLHLICIFTSNIKILIGISFIIRCFILANNTNSSIYSSEYFPSRVRSLGIQLIFSTQLIGQVIAPFYVNYSQMLSVSAIYIGLMIMEVLSTVFSFLIIETKDKILD